MEVEVRKGQKAPHIYATHIFTKLGAPLFTQVGKFTSRGLEFDNFLQLPKNSNDEESVKLFFSTFFNLVLPVLPYLLIFIYLLLWRYFLKPATVGLLC